MAQNITLYEIRQVFSPIISQNKYNDHNLPVLKPWNPHATYSVSVQQPLSLDWASLLSVDKHAWKDGKYQTISNHIFVFALSAKQSKHIILKLNELN